MILSKRFTIHKTKYSRICIVEKLKYVFGTSLIYTHTCNVHSFVFQNKVQIELTLYTSRHRWHETCVNNFEFILQKCTIDESIQKSSKKIHEPKPNQVVKSKPRKSCGYQEDKIVREKKSCQFSGSSGWNIHQRCSSSKTKSAPVMNFAPRD